MFGVAAGADAPAVAVAFAGPVRRAVVLAAVLAVGAPFADEDRPRARPEAGLAASDFALFDAVWVGVPDGAVRADVRPAFAVALPSFALPPFALVLVVLVLAVLVLAVLAPAVFRFAPPELDRAAVRDPAEAGAGSVAVDVEDDAADAAAAPATDALSLPWTARTWRAIDRRR